MIKSIFSTCLDMLLLHRLDRFNPSFFYKAGIDVDHSFLLEDVLLTNTMNESYVKKNYKGKVEVIKKLSEYLKKRNIRKLEMELSTLPAAIFQQLIKQFQISDASKWLLKKREMKKNEEVAKIRKAAKITQEVLNEIDVWKFKREKELNLYIKRAIEDKGSKVSFIMVASGAATSFPHYEARDVPLKDPVVVDVCAMIGYYKCDITETFSRIVDIKVIRRKLKEMVDLALYVKSTKELNIQLRKAYKYEGLPLPPHQFGHGIGLDVHELPSFNSNTKLEGKTFAVEPAVYFKDYGIRYERNFIGRKEHNLML